MSAGLAARAVPTLTLGLGGWLRSLAISGVQHRRAVTVGLLAPLLPVLAIQVFALVLVLIAYHVPVALAKVAGIPVAALLAAALGRWDALFGAIVFGAVGEWIAGSVVLPPRWARRASNEVESREARRLTLRLIWRAIGWRGVTAIFPGAMLVGWAHLHRVNN